MKVAVWKIDDWKPSKWNDGDIKRIIFKGLDDNKSYYLNLSDKYIKRVEQWLPYIVKGNVLNVQLQPNGKNINYFENFQVVKEVKNED